MGKQWKQWQTLFGGCFKIITDGDYSHEIKRCLLLGRKVMTNLDSIFNSRDIILPTKVCIVKAMVFPVVICGYESWTIKAECQNWCFRSIVLDKTLESPLDCKEIRPILKEFNPEYSLEGLMLKLKLQCFGHLMQTANSLEKTLILQKTEDKKRRMCQRMRC